MHSILEKEQNSNKLFLLNIFAVTNYVKRKGAIPQINQLNYKSAIPTYALTAFLTLKTNYIIRCCQRVDGE